MKPIREISGSLGEGIDIYTRSWENQRTIRNDVEIPGGIYQGGDISIGGGQVVGVSSLRLLPTLSDVKKNLDRLRKQGNLQTDS